jgi:hypothetical protein
MARIPKYIIFLCNEMQFGIVRLSAMVIPSAITGQIVALEHLKPIYIYAEKSAEYGDTNAPVRSHTKKGYSSVCEILQTCHRPAFRIFNSCLLVQCSNRALIRYPPYNSDDVTRTPNSIGAAHKASVLRGGM